jgi:hypothetical protein
VDGNIDLTIAAGYYDSAQLITAVEAAFNALATNNLTMTLNLITKKYNFAIDGGDTISTSLDIISNMNTTVGISDVIAPVASFNAQDFPALTGLTRVYVLSSQLAKQHLSDSDERTYNIIASVPIEAPFGGQVSYESQSTDIVSINYGSSKKMDSEIDITLLDQDFRVVDLNGHHVILEFLAYHHA